MKYLPIRELESVSSALNFETPDCRVVGSCDLYTTKAAGSDKKLYKAIEQTLESQHESLLRLSESLSPPNQELFALNLSRSSPFGNLSQVSSRRTFAYLIATLNASHPDYDFSHNLRPSDFRKERSLRRAIHAIDDTLYSLRPRPAAALLAPHSTSLYAAVGPQTPGGSVVWSPRVWKIIDAEMTLRECDIYRFLPQDDPFEDDEGAIWSMHFFFFNKVRRRVLYVHFRGLSASNNKMPRTPAMATPRKVRTTRRMSFESPEANKRTKHSLDDAEDRPSYDLWVAVDDDDLISGPDEPVDMDEMLSFKRPWSDGENDDIDNHWHTHGVRAVSEDIAEAIEV